MSDAATDKLPLPMDEVAAAGLALAAEPDLAGMGRRLRERLENWATPSLVLCIQKDANAEGGWRMVPELSTGTPSAGLERTLARMIEGAPAGTLGARGRAIRAAPEAGSLRRRARRAGQGARPGARGMPSAERSLESLERRLSDERRRFEAESASSVEERAAAAAEREQRLRGTLEGERAALQAELGKLRSENNMLYASIESWERQLREQVARFEAEQRGFAERSAQLERRAADADERPLASSPVLEALVALGRRGAGRS